MKLHYHIHNNDFIRHHANIRRLFRGEESKITFKKK